LADEVIEHCGEYQNVVLERALGTATGGAEHSDGVTEFLEHGQIGLILRKQTLVRSDKFVGTEVHCALGKATVVVELIVSLLYGAKQTFPFGRKRRLWPEVLADLTRKKTVPKHHTSLILVTDIV
jgi:hypothetical protein